MDLNRQPELIVVPLNCWIFDGQEPAKWRIFREFFAHIEGRNKPTFPRMAYNSLTGNTQILRDNCVNNYG